MGNLTLIDFLALEIFFPREIAIFVEVTRGIDPTATLANGSTFLRLDIFAPCLLLRRECLKSEPRHEINLFGINCQQLK
jgi:hypothetical protein